MTDSYDWHADEKRIFSELRLAPAKLKNVLDEIHDEKAKLSPGDFAKFMSSLDTDMSNLAKTYKNYLPAMRIIDGEMALDGPLVANPTQVRTIEQAETMFITQMKSRWSPHGDDFLNMDCGPTCLAMALKHFKIVPDGEDPLDLIRAVRFHEDGVPFGSQSGEGSNTSELVKAAKDLGLAAKADIGTVNDIDNSLARGNLVILGGKPQFSPEYMHASGDIEMPGGHYIIVCGKTASGDYIVNDPACNKGPFSVSAASLTKYIGKGNTQPIGVSVGDPSTTSF